MENKSEKRNWNLKFKFKTEIINIITLLSMNLPLQNCLHNAWLKKKKEKEFFDVTFR